VALNDDVQLTIDDELETWEQWFATLDPRGPVDKDDADPAHSRQFPPRSPNFPEAGP
jgi:hypothetical protein